MFYVFFSFGGAVLGSMTGMLLAFPVTLLLDEWTGMSRYALVKVCFWLIASGAILGFLVGVVAVYKAEAKLKQK